VPHTELAPATLRRVVESYVLREGTDYGEREFTFEEKVAHVLDQLDRGEALITYDPLTETINLVQVTALPVQTGRTAPVS
jgi:hypothetical protein